MKNMFTSLIITLWFASIFSQNTEEKKIDLNEFNLSNISSPAFVLINESPTEIYVPENLKALTIHALNNFNGNISIEVSPYYFLSTKDKNRTFLKYIGIKKDGDKYTQNPFSGLNTTTFSFAYANKEFENLINDNRKVFSIGLRTKLIRFYNKKDIIKYNDDIAAILETIEVPQNILSQGNEAINEYYQKEETKKKIKKIELYKKPIKPIFQLDGAIGYSTLFEENNIESSTLNRFGAWLTSEFSLILNDDSDSSKSNNYFNAFLVGRYIEDEFNINNNTLFYRDFGGKVEFEFGKLSFGYEYIKRKGSIENERSVGSIKYLINKNISLNGGFGKDFSVQENLVTLFGVNWGLNFGEN